MQYKLYSIYDEITQTYNLPFSVLVDQEAVRHFRLLANDPATMIAKSPQDYSLYFIGTYNDQTGFYTNSNPPTLIHKATSLLNPLQPLEEK